MICASRFVFLTTLCGLGLASASDEPLIYKANPTIEWETRVQTIRGGNGVFLSPDEQMLVSSTSLGYVSAFDANDGSELWNYVPITGDNEFLSCNSGIKFSSSSSMEYMVLSVVVNELSPNPMVRIVALSMEGEELWVSDLFEGISAGTPVVSGNGEYVFVTHNSDQGTVGHFSILDGLSGSLFLSQENEDAPFAPPGIHHAPEEGYYEGGENNRNDILVWSVQPKPDDDVVGSGGQFAFQFPIGFAGVPDGIGYIQLGNDNRDFQTIQKPVFTNGGRSLYWGTTRSQFRCWIGEEGKNRYRFNRPRTATLGFSRGKPPSQSVYAPLALTNSQEELFLFGGTASTEFVKLNANFTEELLITTTGLVKTEARISPDDRYVYYVEFNGYLHQASTEDLMDSWVYDIRVPVEGESALRKDGTILYIADVTGSIHALRVAEHLSEAPSSPPTKAPTATLTALPTNIASNTPTRAPTAAPTANPISSDKPINVEPIKDLTSNDPGSSGAPSEAARSAAGFFSRRPASCICHVE